MRRLLILVAMVGVLLPACGGGDDGRTRTVLTDFNHDEFATSIFGYFPRITPVHPGDTIEFKQAWTGEAHTVTFGTLLKPVSDIVRPFFFGEAEPPEDEPPGLEEASATLPFWFGENGVNQTAGQPCYLKSGDLPADEKACPRVAQPAFTGTESFYNSGFIPYEGNGGNRFRMELSSAIEPGDYFYYCLLHGAGMGGFLQVKAADEEIPSQGELSRTARRELDEITKALTEANDNPGRGLAADFGGDVPKYDVLAGGFAQGKISSGVLDEFYPKRFTARVGQKVTWLLMGHTVSFKVPRYGPQVRIDPKTHEVRINEQAYNAVGVEIPETEVDFEGPTPAVDAGEYDGSTFLSSGVQYGMPFSITFTKPGTYAYACTIHPRQVGTLVVRS